MHSRYMATVASQCLDARCKLIEEMEREVEMAISHKWRSGGFTV